MLAKIATQQKELSFVSDTLKAYDKQRAEEIAKAIKQSQEALTDEQRAANKANVEAKARGYGEGKQMGD